MLSSINIAKYLPVLSLFANLYVRLILCDKLPKSYLANIIPKCDCERISIWYLAFDSVDWVHQIAHPYVYGII